MMKKTCTLAVLLLCLFYSGRATAQVGEPRNDLSIGANAGVALNSVFFDPTISQAMKPGATGGFTLRYVCEKYFGLICALQTELNFTQLGWKEVIKDSPDTYQRTVNYVQFPMLANLGYGREERGFKGYLVIGPQIGYYISDKAKKNAWENEFAPQRPNNVVQQYSLPIQRKFEYGLTGGAGVELSTVIGHMMIEGRYYFGLSDMFNNSKADPFARSANGTIVAKFTYLFDVVKTKGANRR